MVSEPPSAYRQHICPEWVKTCEKPSFLEKKVEPRRTKRQKQGLAYELHVHRHLESIHGLYYIAGQWWKYFAGDRVRYCQTDGILLVPEKRTAIILEVKYSHTVDAYWQLENLYLPLLTRFLRGSSYTIATVEVVNWYDPAVRIPRQPRLLEHILMARPGDFSVHIMRK